MTGWLVETTFAVTILMLLVLAVRRPVAHFFGAGWAYALWLLPALRLVLPPLDFLGLSMPSLLPAVEAAPIASAPAAAVPAEAAAAFNWEPVLLAAWLGGAVLFMLWQSFSYVAFMRRLGIGSRVHASLAQDIGIIESAEVDGPIAIGLLDRWIVVPADFSTRYSPEEQRLALQHERFHHEREDIFSNMVALAMLSLNWFNPIAYAAFRAFRTDQELSCDAAVAAMATGEERCDYARALVKSASKPGLIAACPLNHATQLKRRLRMMKAHRRSVFRTAGGAAALGLLLTGGLGITASANAPTEPLPAPQATAAERPAQAAPQVAAPAVKAARAEAPKRRQVASIARPARQAAPAAPAPKADAPEAPVAAEPAPAPAPNPAPEVTVDQPVRVAVLRERIVSPDRVKVLRTEISATGELNAEMKAKLEALVSQHASLSQALRGRKIERLFVRVNTDPAKGE